MWWHTGEDAHLGGSNNGVTSAAEEWVAEGGVVFHCAKLARRGGSWRLLLLLLLRLPARWGEGEGMWGLGTNGDGPESASALLLGGRKGC